MKLKEKNRVIRVGMCVLVLMAIIPVTALAVPGEINYQGYLTDAQGNPVNGNVAITFRIWSAEVGGTALWSESYATVAVSEGVFNVVLGSSMPITAGILGEDCYLGITVGTDTEMVPRTKVTSVAYSIKAGFAESVANGSVTTSALSDTAVTEAKIASGAISSDKLAGGSVSGAKVAAGTLTATHLQDGTAIAEIADDDGAGSGLDADMLDGQHGSYYLNWSNITNVPAGFSDGVDNTGITTETDPEVGSNTVNYVPKWNGTALVAGAIYDNGNIGIGTFTPDQKLHVKGIAHFDVGTGHIHLSTPGGWPGIIAYSKNGNRRDIQFYDNVMTIAVGDSALPPANTNGITIGENGSLGIGTGTALPSEKLEVAGNIRMPNNSSIYNADGKDVFHTGWSSLFGDYTTINSGYAWGSGEPVSVVAGSAGVFFTKGDASGTPYAETLMKVDTNGNVGIGTTNPVRKLTVRGNLLIQSQSTGTDVVELGEGLDYAEGFDVSSSGTVEAGSVLVIDPDHPGKLTLSSIPYDTKVAGIVAGAKGLGSGVRLGVGRFGQDVALAGRVYCNVDAGYRDVAPGDLLTTSPTPGYAMKVGDFSRAQGAILGKAMQRLEKGQKGQILVLVTLQ